MRRQILEIAGPEQVNKALVEDNRYLSGNAFRHNFQQSFWQSYSLSHIKDLQNGLLDLEKKITRVRAHTVYAFSFVHLITFLVAECSAHKAVPPVICMFSVSSL